VAGRALAHGTSMSSSLFIKHCMKKARGADEVKTQIQKQRRIPKTVDALQQA
jgi:hypothetical protein